MVKGVLTLFLFLTISIPLSAQQYILQGVVTDSLTKEPLPYASVRLKDRRNDHRKRRTFLLQDQPFRSSAGSFSDRL